MIVLGVDIGIANTGYGLVRSAKMKFDLIDHGVIKTSAKSDSEIRLQKIYTEISDLITQNQPDAIVIEEIYFGKNVSSALSVGEARGVVKLAAAENNRPVFDYHPAKMKSAIVGHGNATKNQIQEMIKILLNLKEIPKPDHAADALALAICHLRSQKIEIIKQKSKK